MEIFNSYVKLPEGKHDDSPIQNGDFPKGNLGWTYRCGEAMVLVGRWSTNSVFFHTAYVSLQEPAKMVVEWGR